MRTTAAASDSNLYAIDLETGKAMRLGTIGDGRIVLIGLAVPGVAFTRR